MAAAANGGVIDLCSSDEEGDTRTNAATTVAASSRTNAATQRRPRVSLETTRNAAARNDGVVELLDEDSSDEENDRPVAART